MIVYLICFGLSCSFLYLSYRLKGKCSKKVFELIGIFIPCILAGLRDLSIGTDVEVYLKNIFNASMNAGSWKEYLNYGWYNVYTTMHVSDYEIAFIYIVYVVAKIFSNIHVVMFFIELLIILPLYSGIKRIFKNDGCAIAFSMLVYYLSMYNSGLNIMRQYIAISFLFLATCCLINKQNVRCIIYMIVSFLFHKSSLLGILILILYKVMNLSLNFKIRLGEHCISLKKILIACIFCFGVFIAYNMNIVVNLLNATDLSRYGVYISGNFSINLYRLIMIIPIIFVIYRNKESIFKEKDVYFYLLIYVLSQIAIQLASIRTYTIRISYFFRIFDTIFLTIICRKNSRIQKKLSFIIIVILLFYWTYTYVIENSGHTIPYIIGI